MTPGEAIHRKCVECVGSGHAVQNCDGDKMIGGQGDKNGVCYLFPYRLGRGRPSVKIIKKECFQCQGGSKTRTVQPDEVYKGVKFCLSPKCPLYPFRMGKSPGRAGMTNTGSFKSGEKRTVSREIEPKNGLSEAGR